MPINTDNLNFAQRSILEAARLIGLIDSSDRSEPISPTQDVRTDNLTGAIAAPQANSGFLPNIGEKAKNAFLYAHDIYSGQAALRQDLEKLYGNTELLRVEDSVNSSLAQVAALYENTLMLKLFQQFSDEAAGWKQVYPKEANDFAQIDLLIREHRQLMVLLTASKGDDFEYSICLNLVMQHEKQIMSKCENLYKKFGSTFLGNGVDNPPLVLEHICRSANTFAGERQVESEDLKKKLQESLEDGLSKALVAEYPHEQYLEITKNGVQISLNALQQSDPKKAAQISRATDELFGSIQSSHGMYLLTKKNYRNDAYGQSAFSKGAPFGATFHEPVEAAIKEIESRLDSFEGFMKQYVKETFQDDSYDINHRGLAEIREQIAVARNRLKLTQGYSSKVLFRNF